MVPCKFCFKKFPTISHQNFEKQTKTEKNSDNFTQQNKNQMQERTPPIFPSRISKTGTDGSIASVLGKKNPADTLLFGSRHGAAVLHAQVPKKCTDLDLTLLYILIFETYSKFAWKL